jgi:predicted nuclease of restriction endonuclease-like (RecB) superfamily
MRPVPHCRQEQQAAGSGQQQSKVSNMWVDRAVKRRVSTMHYARMLVTQKNATVARLNTPARFAASAASRQLTATHGFLFQSALKEPAAQAVMVVAASLSS